MFSFASVSQGSGSSSAAYLPRRSVTIYPTRARFEAGMSRMFAASPASCRNSAILHVVIEAGAVEADLRCTPAGAKMLNLIGNILRARVRNGALAYLGDGKFGVLLQGVGARDAVAYTKSVLKVIYEIRLPWNGKLLTVSAYVGGVTVDAPEDGMTLLDTAEAAGQLARDKFGMRIHMVRDRKENIQVWQEDLPDNVGHHSVRLNRNAAYA